MLGVIICLGPKSYEGHQIFVVQNDLGVINFLGSLIFGVSKIIYKKNIKNIKSESLIIGDSKLQKYLSKK